MLFFSFLPRAQDHANFTPFPEPVPHVRTYAVLYDKEGSVFRDVSAERPAKQKKPTESTEKEIADGAGSKEKAALTPTLREIVDGMRALQTPEQRKAALDVSFLLVSSRRRLS